MGKIIFEFDSIEESEEARTALDGSNWKMAMWRLDQDLRNIIKHGHVDNREATSEEIEAADDLRTRIREILNDYNLDLE
jgi:HD-like signal output (HDOD) protein